MSDRDNITLPREAVEKAIKAFENGCPPTCENGMIDSGGFSPWGEPILEPCPACLAFEHIRAALAAPRPEPFVIKHYTADLRPTIKGNGFDGLEIGISREEAEEFVAWVNARIAAPPAAAPDEDIEALRRDAKRIDWLERNGIGCEKVGNIGFFVWRNGTRYAGDTPRAAIDAAMEDKTFAAIDAAMQEDNT